MPVVLERPLVVKHRSNWCSGGSCCVLIHWGAAIVLPFVIAFAAGGLWTKEVARASSRSCGSGTRRSSRCTASIRPP